MHLQPDGTVTVIGESNFSVIDLSWEEPPANWISELWFEQERLFYNGPFVSMATRAEIADKGTLDAGESRTLPASLHPGEYRIRTLEFGDELNFVHDAGIIPDHPLISKLVPSQEPGIVCPV